MKTAEEWAVLASKRLPYVWDNNQAITATIALTVRAAQEEAVKKALEFAADRIILRGLVPCTEIEQDIAVANAIRDITPEQVLDQPKESE